MKKYISLFLIFSLSLNVPVFAKNSLKTSEIVKNDNTFIQNGIKYSIINENCVALESYSNSSEKIITLPETVLFNGKTYFLKEIKENAFANNNIIEIINLNKNLENIENNPFKNIAKLKEIKTPNYSKNFNSINGVLFSKDKKTLFAYPNAKVEKSYVTPLDTFFIKNYAFANNENLETICFNSNLKEIGEFAFYNTKKLKEIKYAQFIKRIDNNAFENSSIKRVEFSNNLEFLGDSVFKNSNIENFVIPAKITYIPEYTFFNCKNLKSVSLHNRLTVIKKFAFANSSLNNLKNSYKLENIEESAFENCDINYIFNTENLKSIEKNAFKGSNIKEFEISKYIKEINPNTFENTKNLCKISVDSNNEFFISYNDCLYKKGKKELIIVPENLNLPSFSIPDETEKININNFKFNNNLLEFIVSENNRYFSVKDGILYSKDGNTLIKYPTGKKSENFLISENVEKIERLAFENAQNITGVFNISKNVEKIDLTAFENSSISSFFVQSNNENFASENGLIYTKNFETIYKCPPNSQNKEYKLNKKTKNIGEYAFANTNVGIVYANDNLINIQNNAFENCNINQIKLEYQVKKIGDSAFKNSTIISIELPKNFEIIEKFAFENCKNLNQVLFKGNKVKLIEKDAFKNCDSLQIISIPKNYLKIYQNLLNGKVDLNIIKEI